MTIRSFYIAHGLPTCQYECVGCKETYHNKNSFSLSLCIRLPHTHIDQKKKLKHPPLFLYLFGSFCHQSTNNHGHQTIAPSTNTYSYIHYKWLKYTQLVWRNPVPRILDPSVVLFDLGSRISRYVDLLKDKVLRSKVSF